MELMTDEKIGFKRTDVGFIPEDWEIVKLGDLSDITSSKRIMKSEYRKSGVPFYRSKEIIDKSRNTYEGSDIHIPFERYESLKRKYGAPIDGEILVSAVGTLGVSYLIKEIDLPFYFKDGNLIWLRNLSKKVNADFLTFYFNSSKFKKEIDKTTAGSSQRALTIVKLKNFNIPLSPTLAEQQAIATVLSDIDELIRCLDGLIQKKEAIKKGIMQQLLTGKKRLPGFDGEWEVRKLGEIGNTINGLSGKTKADFGDGNHPYITFMNVMSNTVIDTSIFDTVKVRRGESQSEIKKGDLLFNTSSETPEEVGMCSVLLVDVENLHLNSFCFGYRIHEQDEVLPLFLAYYFRSEFGRKHMQALAQGSTRYNLSKSKFVKIEMELPEFEEQKAIAQTLSDMDRELQTLRQKREKFVQIKQGMMQELLTGRIRIYGMGG